MAKEKGQLYKAELVNRTLKTEQHEFQWKPEGQAVSAISVTSLELLL